VDHFHAAMTTLCADLGPAPAAEDIDQGLREMWAGFPRDDV
jgi:hypothetical protein